VALERQGIVAAALGLLDEVGLDGLSVRRLATELGVKSPALYWHFENKQQLLDDMAEVMQRSAPAEPPAPGQSWDEWMFARTVSVRRMLLRYRDGARLVAGSSPTPRVLAELDTDVATLAGFGFAPIEALGTIMSLSHYVTGFVLQEQAVQRRLIEAGLDPSLPDLASRLVGLLGEAPAPALREAFAAGGAPIGDAAFESGARLIIAGLAATSRR
jgi:TetR/AcrR family tetracycline transcriptional repressor